MDNFDDFDTQIQSDELIPWGYEDEDSRGLTADERDERGLHGIWRDECADDLTDEDEDEFCAVFGADDPDNYLGSEYEESEGDDGDDNW
jgi:hypothetical protein